MNLGFLSAIWQGKTSFKLVLGLALVGVLFSIYLFLSPSEAIYQGQNPMPVYTQPDLSAAILGQINQGDKIRVVRVHQGWVEVRFEDDRGYVPVQKKPLRNP